MGNDILAAIAGFCAGYLLRQLILEIKEDDRPKKKKKHN